MGYQSLPNRPALGFFELGLIRELPHNLPRGPKGSAKTAQQRFGGDPTAIEDFLSPRSPNSSLQALPFPVSFRKIAP